MGYKIIDLNAKYIQVLSLQSGKCVRQCEKEISFKFGCVIVCTLLYPGSHSAVWRSTPSTNHHIILSQIWVHKLLSTALTETVHVRTNDIPKNTWNRGTGCLSFEMWCWSLSNGLSWLFEKLFDTITPFIIYNFYSGFTYWRWPTQLSSLWTTNVVLLKLRSNILGGFGRNSFKP